MKKIYLLLLTFISMFFISTINARCATLVQEKIPDIWIFRKGGGQKAFSSPYYNYSIEGKTTYCIEPGIHITTADYLNTDGLISSPYNDEINNQLELIGYYGFDYPGHNTLEYRMATQALIWEVTGGQIVEFWTKASGAGNYISVAKEKNEIKKLISEHYKVPSFNDNTIDTYINSKIEIIDENNILEKFEVLSSDKYEAFIEGNILKIVPKTNGDITVALAKKTYVDNSSTVFVGIDEISQKMGYFGLTDKVISTLNIKSIAGYVNVIKKDSDNNTIIPQGDAKLTGAIYGIYTESDEKVGSVTIVDNSIGKSDFLPHLGRYYLKEEVSSLGYTLDDTKYYFEITEDNLTPEVTVYEKVIKRDFELFKVLESLASGVLTAEENTTFEFYLKSNMELYTTATTNKYGKLKVRLPYGTYVVKQVNSKEGYEKVPDFEITIDENTDEIITKVVKDKGISAKLKLIKIDSKTKKVINNKSFKFKIKNLDTNEYICQKISYPSDKNVCIFETSNGYFITPSVLDPGNYQIEEVENQQFSNYLWNPKTIQFSIFNYNNLEYDENLGYFIQVYFENEEVKGEVNVNKLGEKITFKDNNYQYEEIFLDDVTYDLYADDNIYSGDNSLIYKKGDFIDKFITKNGGFKITNLHLGKYCLVETSTNENHILDSTPRCFELKYKDQYTPKIVLNLTFKNYLKKSIVDFTKKDELTGDPLENSIIQIYNYEDDENNSKLIFEGTTDNFGKIIIKNLFKGKFFLIEKEAPEGYALNEEKIYFEIDNNTETINLELTNKKVLVENKVFEVPKTDLFDYTKQYSLFILLIGIYTLYYVKNIKE